MYLGIEIGGTKLQLGVGPGDGTLAGLWRGPVDRAAGAAGIRAQIVAAVPDLLANAGVSRDSLRATGIGFGGPVDHATRATIKSHQIDGWDAFPLGAWAADALGLPCRIGNDADVAGLAEATWGAGRGRSPVLYLTLGSGLGGGLILDGRVCTGTGRGAAEVGHLKVRHPTGWRALEDVASGWGIERLAAEQGLPQRTVAALAAAADSGEATAAALLDASWTSLAEALCHAIALVCPAVVVIGGGVSLVGDALFVPLRAKVAAEVFAPFAGCTEIVPAALGETVVVHGALALAAG